MCLKQFSQVQKTGSQSTKCSPRRFRDVLTLLITYLFSRVTDTAEITRSVSVKDLEDETYLRTISTAISCRNHLVACT